MSATQQVVLEPAAQDLVEVTAKPPFLYELGPQAARHWPSMRGILAPMMARF